MCFGPRSPHFRKSDLVLVLSIALAPAAAQTFVPVSQQRSVSGFVNAAQCGPQFVSENKTAPGLGLFDETAEAVHACAMATALGIGGQYSLTDPDLLLAIGSAYSLAEAGPKNVIHAISGSSFEVDFQVLAPVDVLLEGSVSAQGMSPQYAYVTAALYNPLGLAVVEHTVTYSPPGGPATEDFIHKLALTPGTYKLVGEASSVIDTGVPPELIGDALFAFVLAPVKPCTGDIDGDGKTCQSDLGALLAAFGTCAGEPAFNAAANLTWSGSSAACIDQQDLGALLADYGCGGCP